jgi:tetratricopeptide (TPR) repeat protein
VPVNEEPVSIKRTEGEEPVRMGAGAEWESLLKESRALFRKGDHERAIKIGNQALEVAEKSVGPDHPDVVKSLNGLASIYYAQGRYAEAEPLYIRSLAIREKAFGPDHRQLAVALNGLSGLYYVRGEYADAEREGGSLLSWDRRDDNTRMQGEARKMGGQ